MIGSIICRLDAGSEPLVSLTETLDKFDTIFWIRVGGGSFQRLKSDNESLLSAGGAFEFATRFTLPSKDQLINVYISTWGHDGIPPHASIAGFPYTLEELNNFGKPLHIPQIACVHGPRYLLSIHRSGTAVGCSRSRKKRAECV